MTKNTRTKTDIEKINIADDASDVEIFSEKIKPNKLTRFLSRRNFVLILVVLLLVAVFYLVGFRFVSGYWPWADQTVQDEVILRKAVSALEKHMITPQGTPLLATVVDVEQLKIQQPFFNNAQNGDYLLIFADSAQAVLYSPSRDVIVNVGPIQYGEQVSQEPVPAQTLNEAVTTDVSKKEKFAFEETVGEAESALSVLTVEVRNGSGKNGLASTVATKVESIKGVKISGVGDAVSVNHIETVIVDLSDTDEQQKLVEQLASELGAKVVTVLPEDEAVTEADVLVVVGSDYNI